MFYWNKVELESMAWGEDGDRDDHIVPYQKGNEDYDKDLSQDSTRQTVQNTHRTKSEAHGRKLGSNSNLSTNKRMVAPGFFLDSWPEPSPSNATKTGQNCVGSKVSENASETTKYGSSDGTFELVKDHEVFEHPELSKEQGDFVDDGWGNIGSFDDFDRVFSNDDEIFGDGSTGNDEELWDSSKDVSDSPMKSLLISLDSPSLGLGTLTDKSEHLGLGFKTEHILDDKPFTLDCEKMYDPTYNDSQNSGATIDCVEYVGGKNNHMLKKIDCGVAGKAIIEKPHFTTQNVVTPNKLADKTYGLRKQLKSKKSDERSGGKVLQDLFSSWSSPINTPSIVQSHNLSIVGQQRQLQEPDYLHCQPITDQFMPSPAYGSPYPTMSTPSHLQSAELKDQPLLYGYKASPVNAITPNKSALKHQTMTPQEKIEKLRRRQQLQAMLAIKKQQQQFNHHTSTDNCINQNCPQGNQTQHLEVADLEVGDLSNLSSHDPSSTVDHEDSNAISAAAGGYSWEEIILNRLQDTVAKLDTRIRLCIRDSLRRLGHSAVQRQYASDTSSTSKSSRDEHGTLGKQEMNNTSRYARMPDAETETNLIDRTVARLLFHRNLEIPESPSTTKIPCDRKTTGLKNLHVGRLPENSKTKQTFSHQGYTDPFLLAEPHHVDQFKTNFDFQVSENASFTGPVDGEAMEVETSQQNNNIS